MVLKAYFLEVYFKYILQKIMDLFRVHLSQWTTLWIGFNCLKAAESQWRLTFNHQISVESLILIRLIFEGWKAESVFSATLWFWNWYLCRVISRIWKELPFFANALFWASGDNLSLKYPASSCKQVAFAAGVQGKPKHRRALKVAKGP